MAGKEVSCANCSDTEDTTGISFDVKVIDGAFVVHFLFTSIFTTFNDIQRLCQWCLCFPHHEKLGDLRKKILTSPAA